MAKQKSASPRKSKRGPRGQVGPQTYDQVCKLVADRKISLTKAFDEIARETGRKPGTVSNTYYRVARLKAASTNGTAPKAKLGRPRSIGAAPEGPEALLSRIAADFHQLRIAIAEQAKALKELKGDADLAARIRKAMQL
jgi:hypothetical protein